MSSLEVIKRLRDQLPKENEITRAQINLLLAELELEIIKRKIHRRKE